MSQVEYKTLSQEVKDLKHYCRINGIEFSDLHDDSLEDTYDLLLLIIRTHLSIAQNESRYEQLILYTHEEVSKFINSLDNNDDFYHQVQEIA